MLETGELTSTHSPGHRHSAHTNFLGPPATHYLVSRLAAVHQVREEDGILGAGQPAGRHLARTLLNSDALVVLVDGLRGTNRWSKGPVPSR